MVDASEAGIFHFHTAMGIFLAAFIHVLARRDPDNRDVLDSLSAMFICWSLAAFLFSLRGQIHHFWTISLTQIFICAINAFFYRAICQFAGKEFPLKWLLILFLPSIAWHAWFTYVDDHVLMRALELGLIAFVIHCLAVGRFIGVIHSTEQRWTIAVCLIIALLTVIDLLRLSLGFAALLANSQPTGIQVAELRTLSWLIAFVVILISFTIIMATKRERATAFMTPFGKI